MKFTSTFNGVSLNIEAPASVIDNMTLITNAPDGNFKLIIPEVQPATPEPTPAPVLAALGNVYTVQLVTDPDAQGPHRSGWNKIAFIKAIRETTGLGLYDSKTLSESGPCNLWTTPDYASAMELRDKLRVTGSNVEIAIAMHPASTTPLVLRKLPVAEPVPTPAPDVDRLAPYSLVIRDGGPVSEDERFRASYSTRAEAQAAWGILAAIAGHGALKLEDTGLQRGGTHFYRASILDSYENEVVALDSDGDPEGSF